MKGQVTEKWDYETDIAIIGCGAGGSATAILAHDAGAKVLIMEKMSEPSGNITVSAGIVYAAGTSVQKAAGIEDSAERLYKFHMAVMAARARTPFPKPDPEKIRMIADGSAEVIEWLIGLGAKFPAVIGLPGLTYAGLEFLPEVAAVVPPVPGGHCIEGLGKGLHDVLLSGIKDRGIESLLEIRAGELIANPEGEIIGVKAEKRGETVYIRAKRGVVLCTGAYENNRDLVEKYFPQYRELSTISVTGIDGDGMLMAQAEGADIERINGCFLIAGLTYEYRRAYYSARFHPCIMVNKSGKRFIDEHIGYSPFGEAVFRQEGSMAFIIFDDYALKTYGSNMVIMPCESADLSGLIEKGLIKTAPTIRVLAQEIGIDPAILETTVATWNENVKLGKDPEFGGDKWLEPMNTPPFYAYKATPVFVPLGGLKTNNKAQVIDVFGRPIPRLYAVGQVGGMPYTEYAGSGGELLSIFIFARIAGRNAAQEVSQ